MSTVRRAWLSAGAGLALLVGASGCTSQIDCHENGTEVDCTIHGSMFGIPTRAVQATGVKHAGFQVTTGQRTESSRVVLMTAKGDVPLTSYSSGGLDSGDEDKQRIVDEVNAYVASTSTAPLQDRSQEGYLSLPCVAFTIGVVAFFTRSSRRKKAAARDWGEQVEHESLSRPKTKTVVCGSCLKPFAEDRVDRVNHVAACGNCHSVFDVT